MTELTVMPDSDVNNLILFFIKKYKLRITIPLDDFIHEVKLNLFLRCPKGINSTFIGKWTRWTLSDLNKAKNGHTSLEIDPSFYHHDPADSIDAVDVLNKLEKTLDLTEQEQVLFSLLRAGLNSAEIRCEMGLKSRQRYEQIKKILFMKIKLLL